MESVTQSFDFKLLKNHINSHELITLLSPYILKMLNELHELVKWDLKYWHNIERFTPEELSRSKVQTTSVFHILINNAEVWKELPPLRPKPSWASDDFQIFSIGPRNFPWETLRHMKPHLDTDIEHYDERDTRSIGDLSFPSYY